MSGDVKRAVVAMWLAVMAMLALALLDSGDADARKRPVSTRELERRAPMPLGWHSPPWRVWDQCTTTVYVTAGPDGIVPGSETAGEKECPAAFSRAKRRGLPAG